ncbi:hypothetical protein Sango_0980300 [Sesamum angolense]|uniref:Transposase-associated domain-containing protein n=1 Tax=Sesamum angolense TaxID=2727404 RepID=A0AAE2BYH8_9LAMI|nr:hypothetical protein Sango_0980300 [Sesamum angolense]
MYNKNISGRAGLTPEFEDGVKTFIEWAKGQRGNMDRDKICPCQKYKNTKFGTLDEVSYHLSMHEFMPEYYNWTSHGEEIVQEYFEARAIPPVSKERTPAGRVDGNYPQWGDEQHMDWVQRLIFYAVGPSYFASSHEGVPDDGMRLYSLRAIAKHMTWHTTHQIEEGLICHPSDTEAWKHFDWMYPDFAENPHNVRLGLCTDSFGPHG